MLKISVIENATRRQVILAGKLIAPWTDELQRICNTNEGDHRELVIDVRELTMISQEGEHVLSALMLQGARFRGSDVFTKQILKQLARRAHPDVPNGKGRRE